VCTYAEINTLANRVAHWALGRGVGRGNVVRLLMANRPEYLAMWLGLAKVGAVTALLNTHLRAELRGADPLFYIYTAGTTGLPKAARLSHARFLGGGIYAALAGMGRDDVFYCPLPLYYTSGGVMAVNAVLRHGATLALARQFSAHHFWDEVADHKATAVQYIGELCRYLVNQPSHPLERSHSLRLAINPVSRR